MAEVSRDSSQDMPSGTTAPVVSVKQTQKPVEKKRSRCQEKNRRAQARFRERQKAKATETEDRMASLEAAVAQLQEEKAHLQMHAHQLQLQLQAGQQQQQQGVQQQGPSQHGPMLHANVPPAPTAHIGMAAADEYSQVLADTHKTGSAGFEVVLPTVTPMAWGTYVAFYKDQIHKMAPLLAPAQAEPHCEAARTCERLLLELSEANRAIFHRSPALRDKVHTQPLVEASEEPRMHPDVALWRQVTAALQMMPAQKRHARELHDYYWNRMRGVMADRQRLSGAMLASCELPADVMHAPDAAGWKPWHQNEDVAAKHTQALEAITALNRNIAEETLAQIEVGHGLFCKVLTPLQACSAYVGLYPFFPDKLAILSCVLELDDHDDAAVRSLVTELVGH